MSQMRFTVLTGHLGDYPIADIFGILRHQGKTGRLLIEYPIAPGIFYFKDGELVDAQLGNLTGLEAIVVSLTQPDASFNFNPLIPPTNRTIDPALQKGILDLIGCWQGDVLWEAETTNPPSGISGKTHAYIEATAIDVPVRQVTELPGQTTLALPPAPHFAANFRGHGRLLLTCGVLLVLVGVPSALALKEGSKKRVSNAVPRPANEARVETQLSSAPESKSPLSEYGTLTVADLPARNAAGEKRRPVSDRHRAEKVPAPIANTPTDSSRAEQAATGSAPAPLAATAKNDTARKQEALAPGDSTITVVTRVENGHVTQAYVANRRPGMEAFEAAALRVARQRRYPAGSTGDQTVQIRINKP